MCVIHTRGYGHIMKGLLLVDIQKDFCKGGALEVTHSEEIIPVANYLIEIFDKNSLFVIATKDWHPKSHKSFAVNSGGKLGQAGELNGLFQVWWPVHCVENTDGAQFHKDLFPVKNIVYKGCNPEVDSYSGFFDNGRLQKTGLDDILKKNNIDTLYIMGLATDYCVKYTVLDALELGYKVYLIEDGVKGVNINPTDSQKAIDQMIEKCANIINSADIIF